MTRSAFVVLLCSQNLLLIIRDEVYLRRLLPFYSMALYMTL